MNLSRSESERMLADVARNFVRDRAARQTLIELRDTEPGYRPEWTADMAAAGWLGLLIPEELGGSGSSHSEAAAVYEELGKAPLPGPYLASSVVTASLLGAFGSAAHPLLGQLASGEAVVVPAFEEPARTWRGPAAAAAVSLDADGSTVTGAKLFVPWADAATHLLVSLAPDATGVPVFAVVDRAASGITARRLPGFLQWSYEVHLDAAPVVSLFTAVDGVAVDEAFARSMPVVAAYQIGGCQALLDRSIDYSNVREQFGTPIGRFQRVQDHIIRILNAMDSARWLTYESLWRIDTERPFRASAHVAKAAASEAYYEAANAAHEVHAGIGSDHDFGLTLHTGWSRTLRDFMGSPSWHKQQAADAFGWSTELQLA